MTLRPSPRPAPAWAAASGGTLTMLRHSVSCASALASRLVETSWKLDVLGSLCMASPPAAST